MKIIPKFNNGGSYDQFFSIYLPLNIKRSSSGRSLLASTKKDDNEGKLTEKDLFTMLKDLDGLPNEMNRLTKSLLSAITNILGGATDIATTYIKSLNKLKLAKYNKDLFKSVYDKAVSEDRINEPAITTDGHVIVIDKESGTMSLLKPELYLANKENYEPVTNSNLLWLRSHSSKYINNNVILLTVENGIGLSAVNKLIKDSFLALGTSAQTNETIVSSEEAAGKKILDQLIQSGPDGYYKLTTSIDNTGKEQIAAALNYIYSMLPTNAKTRLALATEDGSKASLLRLILDMLLGTAKTSSTSEISYLGTEDKLTSSGSGSSGGLKLNAALKWLAGLGKKGELVINLGGSTTYSVYANTMPLTKNGGSYLGANTTLLAVASGEYAPILDWNNVSMGGRHIDQSSLWLVLISDGNISSIDFPCKVLPDGSIIPDLTPDIKARKEKAELEIKAAGISLDPNSIKNNVSTINSIYESNGLPAAYDSNGRPLQGKWARFGVLNAKTSDRALGTDILETPNLLEEETNINIINNYIDAVKDDNYSKPGFFNFSPDRLLKGTVWIPVDVNYINASANVNMSPSLAIKIDIQDLALLNTNSFNSYPRNI